MTKKTNSIELAKWMFWTVIAAIVSGYSFIWLLDSIFTVPDELYSIMPSALVAISFYQLYSRQLARLDNHLPVKEKTGLRATNSRSIKVNGTQEIFLSTVQSIFSREEKTEPAHLLWWNFGPYHITEDVVYEWMRKGWNRQMWGEAHPFSGNWMKDQRFYTLSNQRIELDYHKALCTLLASYQLWLKEPRQGVAGKLIANPAGCLAKIKGKWD